MANTLKFGSGQWATKVGSTLAYNDENGNFKPLPFNFTRSTGGTRVNKDGLIEVVTNNKPRIDFLNDSNGALLLEPQRTNLALYSEQFDNAGWSKTGVGVTANDSTSPDGNTNADKLFNSVGTTGFASQTISLVSSTIYSGSVFAKNAGRNSLFVLFSGSGGSASCTFDLTTLTTTPSGGVTAKIEDYGGGWYRCSVVFTATSTGASAFRIYPTSTTGDGTSGVYLWGAQLEVGSYATSYIPTQGAIAGVTRVAESCNGAGNDQVFNDSEGVLFAEISALANDSTKRRITINNDSSSNFVQLEYRPTTNTIQVGVFNGASQGYFTELISNITLFNKIAYSYKLNEFKLYVNGIQLGVTINSGSVFLNGTLKNLSFDNGAGSDTFYGNVKQIQYYNTALTDAELQALTTI
jgi:hypothetical protein